MTKKEPQGVFPSGGEKRSGVPLCRVTPDGKVRQQNRKIGKIKLYRSRKDRSTRE